MSQSQSRSSEILGRLPPRIAFHSEDAWGGLAAMLVALPSAIAFGVAIATAVDPGLAGMGALMGLVGAAALGIVAPLVGRNPGFITAPCAPAAAVLSGVAAQMALNGKLTTERILTLLALTMLLSGVLQIVYGSLRAGRLIKYIPYQVVTGYLSGVAVIIAISQIPKLLGSPSNVHFGEAVIDPELWQWPGVVVGVVTILTMVLTPRVTRKVPGAIVGVAAGIAVYFAMGVAIPRLLSLPGNRLLVGSITTTGSLFDAAAARISLLRNIQIADLMLVLAPALTLSVLLSIDTLKTGVVLDALMRRRHDSNRELIGQGIANLASFGLGGIPGAGTAGASLVNVSSGGRTIMSSVIEGLLSLAVFLALRNLVAWIPIAALAGVLLVVAWRMFDFQMFRLLRYRSTRLDFAIIASVVVVAELKGLIEAAVVGVSLAAVLFIRNQIQTSVILSKRDLTTVHSTRKRAAAESRILAANGSAGLLVQLRDELFFGTTDQLLSDLESDLGSRRFVLVDLRRVDSMDYTAAHLFEQMRQRLQERGGELILCGMPTSGPMRQDIERYLGHIGLVGQGGVRVFETRDGALEWMENHVLEAAGWVEGENDPPLDASRFELFDEFDETSLAAIHATLEEQTLPVGDVLFHQGDESDEMYLVRRGRIAIQLQLPGGKRHQLATVGPGEHLGDLAFLDRGRRTADAVAVAETELYRMSRTKFDTWSRTHPEIAARFFYRIALTNSKRLRVVDEELRALEDR